MSKAHSRKTAKDMLSRRLRLQYNHCPCFQKLNLRDTSFVSPKPYLEASANEEAYCSITCYMCMVVGFPLNIFTSINEIHHTCGHGFSLDSIASNKDPLPLSIFDGSGCLPPRLGLRLFLCCRPRRLCCLSDLCATPKTFSPLMADLEGFVFRISSSL